MRFDVIRCDEILQRVGPFVDGELDGEEREAVERHLAGCGRCADVALEIREIDVRAKSLPVPAVTAEEWSAVRFRVEARAREARVIPFPFTRTGLLWAIPTAAILLIAAILAVPLLDPPPQPGIEHNAELIQPVSGVEPSIEVISVDEEETPYVRYTEF